MNVLPLRMARKDIYHEIVVAALMKDGWTITDDPLRFLDKEAAHPVVG